MALEERTKLPKLEVQPPTILFHPPSPMTCEVSDEDGEECGKLVVAVVMRKSQKKRRVVASYCQECLLHWAAAAVEATANYAEAVHEWAEKEVEGAREALGASAGE